VNRSGAESSKTAPGPVAVLDSGVGGLSVLREIRHLLPHQDLLYLADQAHIPYGPRSLAQIRRLAVAITRFLLAQDAQVVVLACNTASAAALYHLRAAFPAVPFVGMEPAIKPAAAGTQSRVIGVLATPATFQGELFSSLLTRYAHGVTVVPQICPGLVEQVEAGDLTGDETLRLVSRFVQPLLAAGVDTLVLGCTHYPFLAGVIRQVVGPAVDIVDPSPAVARQTQRVLQERGQLAPSARPGSLTSFTTGDPECFERLASQLVGGAGRVVPLSWNAERTALSPRA
jgi:glutamate racemase